MHLFNILNFKSATLCQVEKYLVQHPNPRYQIIIPKKEFENDPDFSGWQYNMAAYAGHRLSLISTSFAYNVPCPYRIDPFQFNIEYLDSKKLAAVLYHIITGYYIDSNEVISFQDEALKHFHCCFTGKTDSACWGLLHIANKKTF